MKYDMMGVNYKTTKELTEQEILKIIQNGLKTSVENGDITKVECILIKLLIKKDKIKINFEEIGETINIDEKC